MPNVINFYQAAIRTYNLVPRQHKHIEHAVLQFCDKETYHSINALIKTCSQPSYNYREPPFQAVARRRAEARRQRAEARRRRKSQVPIQK
jgi:hypothetical protein